VEDGAQTHRSSDPFARRQIKEMWCWWLLSSVVNLRAIHCNGTRKATFLPPLKKVVRVLRHSCNRRSKIPRHRQETNCNLELISYHSMLMMVIC